MKLLAMDTAGEWGRLALLEGEALQAEGQVRLVRTHAHQLWRILRFLLAEVGWEIEDLEGWVVSQGPGSFTGVRIGLATMKALALVTQKPLAAVTGLEALAAAWIYSPYLIVPVIDARKQEVYFAGYRSTPEGEINPVWKAAHGRPRDLADRLAEPAILVGSGAWLYRSVFREGLGPQALIPPWPYHHLSIRLLGALGLKKIRQGTIRSPREISPLYLRPSDAELAPRPREAGA